MRVEARYEELTTVAAYAPHIEVTGSIGFLLYS